LVGVDLSGGDSLVNNPTILINNLKKGKVMRELTMTEVEVVSGGYSIIPEFPTSLGLVGGMATLLTGAGYIIAVAGTNLALGLNEALGIATPRPF
jgi:hypothetical protein